LERAQFAWKEPSFLEKRPVFLKRACFLEKNPIISQNELDMRIYDKVLCLCLCLCSAGVLHKDTPLRSCVFVFVFAVLVCCCVLQCVAQRHPTRWISRIARSVLRCVAVRCSVLRCVAVCCSVLQCVAVCCTKTPHSLDIAHCSQRVALCCGVLQCIAVRCSVLQCVAVCCTKTPHSLDVAPWRGDQMINDEYAPLRMSTKRRVSI